MITKLISRRDFLAVSAMTTSAFVLDWNRISAYAAKMGNMEDYPTIIIGAGLGGLCCGAYLAKQGIPVTVVEQHGIPGGYATAFDRAKGKYTFEVSLHGTSIHNNASERILKDLGVLDKLTLVELPEVYRVKTPDFDITVPQRDPDAYIRILAKAFPEEKEGIEDFVREMIGLSEEVDKLHRNNGKFFKLIFPIQYRKMWTIRNKTLADLLNEYVKNPSLQNLLADLWGYYGLPPSKLSGFYYANATGGYLKNGSYYIKERSQELSKALAGVIEDAGGKILYDTPVEKIVLKDGSVKGVSIVGGKIIPARTVVGNASALTLFKEMMPRDAVPKDYLHKLERYRPSISSFIVWLGLNGEIKDKIAGSHIYVSTGEGPETAYKYCLNGEVNRGSFGISIYDNVFKGYSNPGSSTVMLLFLCGYDPWRKFEADYKAGRKKDYYKEKERWSDMLIQRAEAAVLPGLSAMIEVKEAATPLTNWRFTGNTEGAIYGFEQSMDNAFMNRIDNRTPIKGLYLAGAWGNPGGGYAGVFRSGERTFQKIMKDWAKD